jgi:Fic family protein
MDASWPPITWEEWPWQAADHGQSRRAQLRAQGPYRAALPPRIAGRDLPGLDPTTAVAVEDAIVSLARFDGEYGEVTAPFASILLRSESASSSEIEQLTAGSKAVALAELGVRTGANAQLIVANRRAMEAAIALAGDLDEGTILAMQEALLGDSQPEHTGGWRGSQVWIGSGFSHSPHTASFVPPHHERVPALMGDLVEFARRTDLPALPQIAVAHAQFETIHPFPDGNGRTGRALVHAMLHRFGITRSVTVPVSAGLLGDVGGYFKALSAYRDGDVGPIVLAFVQAVEAAIANGRQLVGDVLDFRDDAHRRTSARRGSAAWRIVELLTHQPVVNAQAAAAELGVTVQNAQAGIDRLVDDGIVSQVGDHRRNRLYQADAMLGALDAFAQRARRARHQGR